MRVGPYAYCAYCAYCAYGELNHLFRFDTYGLSTTCDQTTSQAACVKKLLSNHQEITPFTLHAVFG